MFHYVFVLDVFEEFGGDDGEGDGGDNLMGLSIHLLENRGDGCKKPVG